MTLNFYGMGDPLTLLFDSHAQNYMDQFLAQGQASANLAEAAETEVEKCADDEFYRVDVLMWMERKRRRMPPMSCF